MSKENNKQKPNTKKKAQHTLKEKRLAKKGKVSSGATGLLSQK
jgi:hypothetical protein